MKTTVKHIIFEFTLQSYSDDKFTIGLFKSNKERRFSENITAYGFILGEIDDFLTNNVLFYN